MNTVLPFPPTREDIDAAFSTTTQVWMIVDATRFSPALQIPLVPGCLPVAPPRSTFRFVIEADAPVVPILLQWTGHFPRVVHCAHSALQTALECMFPTLAPFEIVCREGDTVQVRSYYHRSWVDSMSISAHRLVAPLARRQEHDLFQLPVDIARTLARPSTTPPYILQDLCPAGFQEPFYGGLFDTSDEDRCAHCGSPTSISVQRDYRDGAEVLVCLGLIDFREAVGGATVAWWKSCGMAMETRCALHPEEVVVRARQGASSDEHAMTNPSGGRAHYTPGVYLREKKERQTGTCDAHAPPRFVDMLLRVAQQFGMDRIDSVFVNGFMRAANYYETTPTRRYQLGFAKRAIDTLVCLVNEQLGHPPQGALELGWTPLLMQLYALVSRALRAFDAHRNAKPIANPSVSLVLAYIHTCTGLPVPYVGKIPGYDKQDVATRMSMDLTTMRFEYVSKTLGWPHVSFSVLPGDLHVFYRHDRAPPIDAELYLDRVQAIERRIQAYNPPEAPRGMDALSSSAQIQRHRDRSGVHTKVP